MADAKDSFGDYPEILGEHRPGGASAWTPREAILSMMKEIDSGAVTPVAVIVVALVEPSPGQMDTFVRVSSPNFATTIGMLEMAKIKRFD